MLISLAWVSCKDAANVETETTTAQVAGDSIFISNQNSASMDLRGLRGAVTTKIGELQYALQSTSGAAKAELEAQLATYQKYQDDLDAVSQKVSKATPETWAAIGEEVDNIHFTVKTAITGGNGQQGKTDQIAN